ncbi:GyrI-like domain-containing protein [Rapidithrix thailandica]|uniref:GyrI-like domain-containing protein n=1 Tax=Rapidithrix thailandica TaxID=413964 RepID=A0AAW9SMA9_9BACT
MNESRQVNSEYIFRINKTFDYIELNLEKSMTLEELASVANFSKFHFNRIFHSLVGETPFQFILRLRLEKAASLIQANSTEPITQIAYKCGFSDISVFSRNFKNHFDIPASQYRKEKLQHSNISQLKRKGKQPYDKPSMYFCPDLQTFKWKTKMKINKGVEVKVLPKMTVAYIRSMGPYNGNQEKYQHHRDKLFAWAGARGLLGGKDFNYLVVYHDNPNVALNDNQRMSLCITVPPETKVEGEIGKMEIESTRYAICHFELAEQDFSTAWEWIYGQWFPESGYQPDDKPYFETYPEAPKAGKFIVDFCIPVKPV